MTEETHFSTGPFWTHLDPDLRVLRATPDPRARSIRNDRLVDSRATSQRADIRFWRNSSEPELKHPELKSLERREVVRIFLLSVVLIWRVLGMEPDSN